MAPRLASCLWQFLLTTFLGSALARIRLHNDVATNEASGPSSILLTEAALQSIGSAVENTPAEAQSSIKIHVPGDLVNVCEKTKSALFAEAPTESAPSQILGGPVYRACTESLAPLRAGSEEGSAVKVLNECMVIVDSLLTKLSTKRSADGSTSPDVAQDTSMCQVVISEVEAKKAPPATPLKAFGKLDTSPPEVVAATPQKEDNMTISLVAKAVIDACPETVQEAEVGLKTEDDSTKLGNAVAPVCERKAGARLHVQGSAEANNELKMLCEELDGRLTTAMEIGFFFVLHADAAERLAGKANPYASATRRQFCERFAAAVHKKVGPTPESESSQPASPQKAAVAQPEAKPAATTDLHAQDSNAAKAHPSPSLKTNLDVIHLLQALSRYGEWNQTCLSLVSRLNSQEGAVMEDAALGSPEPHDARRVLTFNELDQGQIKRCSARLKVVAIEAGLLKSAEMQGGHKELAAISVRDEISEGAASLLGAGDQLEELINSPWADEACNDMAHSYLTSHLTHSQLSQSEFCTAYTYDIQSMDDGSASMPAQPMSAQEEIQRLRRRGIEKAKQRDQELVREKEEQAATAAASASASLALTAQKAAAASLTASSLALTAEKVKVKTAAPSTPAPEQAKTADDDQGAAFWQGMFQA